MDGGEPELANELFRRTNSFVIDSKGCNVQPILSFGALEIVEQSETEIHDSLHDDGPLVAVNIQESADPTS